MPNMKNILLITAVLSFAIVSPIPALDRWQENFRLQMRAGLGNYLPENPHSREERALLREIGAVSDSALQWP
jgi:hypothetical protein